MKKIIMSTLLAAMVVTTPSFVLSAGAINGAEPERGYVSVSYTAEKEVSPDTVEVSIAIRTDDRKTMQEAVRKNKELSDKVYAYLKGQITPTNGDYLKTANYSASPSYVYNNNKRILDKYEVHTKSLDKISTIIDKSLELGATTVDSLNFSLSEKDAQCAELLSNATKQARKRADIVAAAAGSTVIGIRNIDTSCSFNSSRPRYYANSLMMKAAPMADSADAGSGSNIESGTIKVYSNVNANFYLK